MKNIDLGNLKDFPKTLQSAIIIVVCGAVLYLSYFFDITNLKSTLAKDTQQEEELKTELQGLIQIEAIFTSEIAQLPKIQISIKEWQAKLVKESNLSDLLDEILKVGTANNLQFDLFNPGAEVKDGSYGKVPIKTVVVGTFDQISNFISQIANMVWIVAIDDFIISDQSTNPDTTKMMAANPGFLTAELNLDVYHLGEK